jgi:hypothetical protein
MINLNVTITALLLILIANDYSIKRLILKYFFLVEQDHTLIGIGIKSTAYFKPVKLTQALHG